MLLRLVDSSLLVVNFYLIWRLKVPRWSVILSLKRSPILKRSLVPYYTTEFIDRFEGSPCLGKIHLWLLIRIIQIEELLRPDMKLVLSYFIYLLVKILLDNWTVRPRCLKGPLLFRENWPHCALVNDVIGWRDFILALRWIFILHKSAYSLNL